MLSEIAEKTGEWAGIPMPLDGERLVIEPTYPWANLSEIGKPEPEPDDGWRMRNQWYSRTRRCDIILMTSPEGRVTWGQLPAFHHGATMLSTLSCSDAWGIEQEGNAVQLLGRMLRHRQFKQYLLTGMFVERSTRSGLAYVFRKLRPTIAFRPNGQGSTILAALCMHPIGYYAGSWAGAMCPTDDVIAHLALMRGDEHMFWKRCNQHPPYRPEAGI